MELEAREQLAVRLREWRTCRALTAETLANRAGVSIKTVNRLENAKTPNPREHILESIAQALEITRADLVGPRLAPNEASQLDRLEAQGERIEQWLVAIADELGVKQLEGEARRTPPGLLGQELEAGRSKPPDRGQSENR